MTSSRNYRIVEPLKTADAYGLREILKGLCDFPKIFWSLRIFFVSLPTVRGEIRTNRKAFAIISRSAKSLGNLLGIKRNEIIRGEVFLYGIPCQLNNKECNTLRCGAYL